ncbi:MAG: HesB/IscA family protein [Candidatus Krumholzibacteriia bacterium]
MIQITESAVKMLRRIMEKEDRRDAILRLAVRGGGCSGFSYQMAFEDGPREQDLEYDFHGLSVVVDPKSIEFLEGITLDYAGGLNAGFKWVNPNATRTCSCGESFDVQ